MKYEDTWRNKWATSEAQDIDDMIACYERNLKHLRALKKEVSSGKIVMDFSSASDDYILVSTDDAEIAAKFGLEEADDEVPVIVGETSVGVWSE